MSACPIIDKNMSKHIDEVQASIRTIYNVDGVDADTLSSNIIQIISKNNGNKLTQDKNGKPSKTYKELVSLYNGDKSKALAKRYYMFDYEFGDVTDNWWDSDKADVDLTDGKFTDKFGEERSIFLEKESNERYSYSSQKKNDVSDLQKTLKSIADQLGVKINYVSSITDENGSPIDAVGQADMINMVINLKKGAISPNTLPEEISHFIVELLPENSEMYKKYTSSIGLTAEYKDVRDSYGATYNGNENKIKKEALAKILSKAIVKYDSNKPEDSIYKKMARDFVEWISDLFTPYLAFIAPSILDNYRVKSLSRLADKTAGQIISGKILNNIKDITELPKEVYYDLNTEAQDRIVASINEKPVELIKNEFGDIVYAKKDPNDKNSILKEVITRTSDLVKAKFEKIFGHRDFAPITYKGRKINLYADKGTYIHSIMENILRKISSGENVDKDEILGVAKQDVLDVIDYGDVYGDEFFQMTATQFNELKKLAEGIYESAVEKQEAFGGKKEDIVFKYELPIIDDRNNIGSTIDVAIIYSNGVVDLMDFKTTDVTKINTAKMIKWNEQLSINANTLRENYRVSDIGAVRIIPIHVKFNLDKEFQPKDLKFKSLRAIPKKTDKETYEGLSQIPLITERLQYKGTNEKEIARVQGINKALDRITDQITDIEDALAKAKTPSEKDKWSRMYQKRMDDIKKLTIDGNVSSIFLQLYNLAQVTDKRISNSSDSENRMTRSDLKQYKRSLENGIELAENLNDVLIAELDEDEGVEFSKTQLETINKAVSLAKAQLNIVNNRISIDIESSTNLKDADTPFVGGNDRGNMFRGLRDWNDPIMKAAADLLDKAFFKRDQGIRKDYKEIKKFLEKLKEKGISRSDLMKRIVKGDAVVGKHTKEFWKAVKKAREEGNVDFLRESFSFNEEKYSKAREKFIEKLEVKISNTPSLNSNPELAQKFRKEELQSFKMRFNPHNNDNALLNPRNGFLDVVEDIDGKWIDEDYKWVHSEGNEIVKSIYDKFIEMNRSYRSMNEEDPISDYEARKLAFVPKTATEGLMEGSLNPIKLASKFYQSIMWMEADGDQAFGNDVGKSVPKRYLFTYENFVTMKQKSDIKKELDKQGLKEGSVDYKREFDKKKRAQGYKNAKENVTTDLFEQMIAISSGMHDYEHKSGIEEDLIDLSQIMRNRRFHLKSKSGRAVDELADVDLSNEEGYEVLMNLLNIHLYGSNQKNDSKIGKASVSKVASKMGNMLSTKALIFKFPLAMAQFMGGSLNTYLSAIDGEFLDRKSLKKTMKKIKSGKDIKNLGAMTELLNTKARGSNEDMSDRLKSSWAKRNITSKTLFILFTLTDDALDSVMLDAMMNYWMVKDGKIVHPYTISKDKIGDYKTLNEAFNYNEEKGEFSIEGVHKDDLALEIGKFRSKVLNAEKLTRGSTNGDIKSDSNSTIPMKLLMLFRSWIPGLAEQRFPRTNWSSKYEVASVGRYAVGFGEVFGKYNEDESGLNIAKRMLMKTMGATLGIATFGKYTDKLSKEATSFYLRQARARNKTFNTEMNKNFTTEEEMIEYYHRVRENKRKSFMVEFGVMMWLGILFSLWMGFDDDEDDTMLTATAKDITRRFLNESTTFVNPSGYTSLYQNSVPLFQEGIKISKFISNTFDYSRDVIMGQDNPRDRSGFFHYGRKVVLPALPDFIDREIWDEGMQEYLEELMGYSN